MTRLEMDLEKLEVKTQARVDYVLGCYEFGWSVDWDNAEAHAIQAALKLDMDRAAEPFRQIGRSAREFVEAVSAIARVIAEGYEEGPRG